MPTPFPGMDPWLEHPWLWPDVHKRLIAGLADDLGPRLPRDYYTRLDERTYVMEPTGLELMGQPDVGIVGSRGESPGPSTLTASATAVAVQVPVPEEFHDWFLEIRSIGSDELVTAVEILSPANKVPGRGRSLYEEKRMAVLGTRTSLVEVDLLRVGQPMLVFGHVPDGDYRILVRRGSRHARGDLLVFGVRDPIPRFRLPLRGEDTEPDVDLGALLHRSYDRARWNMSIDYSADPVPPLRDADRDWARELAGGMDAR